MNAKTFLTLLFLSVALLLNAQKASLTNAYNHFYEKEYVKAKEAIDLCVQNEKLSAKAQTWLYKGNIYFYLANQEYMAKQNDNNAVIQFPDAPVEAYDAFVKAKELNKNVEGFEMLSPDDALSKLYSLLLVRGVDQLIANDFAAGKATLEKGIVSYEMKTPPEYPLNGELYYYYAIALENLNQPDQAVVYYEKAVKDGSTNPNVLVRLIEQYKQSGDKAKVKSMLDQALAKNPEDANVLVAQVDYYYWIDDSVKARQLLQNLPASVYNNADATVNIANFYIKEKNYTEAEKLLRKAYRLNPNSYVVVFNLGVCTYYLFNENDMKANELKVAGANSEAAVHQAKANNYLDDAERFFEEARRYDANDLNVLTALKQIYARKKSPKYDEIVKKINELEK
ncbi:MAG: tetratricopeptide repeat protein [Bacteroidales bacterium]|nr:tetratricopeptide repeat protein [Bacteroidales bacterium]